MISDDTIAAIAAGAGGLVSGGLHVQKADVRVGYDSQGRDALRIELTLPDPDGDTWPVEAVLDLRRQLNELVASYGLPLGWVISLRSETPTQFDDAEQLG